MHDAVIPMLNFAILGSFMAMGIAQLNGLKK